MTSKSDDEEECADPDSQFASDNGGPLPFKVSSRLELRFLMPAGADLTCIGEGHDLKPSDWIVDVPPNELDRVADLFRRLASELARIKVLRELEQ